MNCIAFCMSRQNGTGCQLVGKMGVGEMGLTRNEYSITPHPMLPWKQNIGTYLAQQV